MLSHLRIVTGGLLVLQRAEQGIARMPCSWVPSRVCFNRDIDLAGVTRIPAAAVDTAPVARQRAGLPDLDEIADNELVDHTSG